MLKAHLSVFIIATLLVGCAGTPTRINVLELENYGTTSDFLNGVLINHEDKYILDKSFQTPTMTQVSFTDIPEGPWEFNGATLFPAFDSSGISCKGCGDKMKGFFTQSSSTTSYPRSSYTYSERLTLLVKEREKERDKEGKLTAGEAVVVHVAAGAAALVASPWLLINLTGQILTRGPEYINSSAVLNKVWFDHDDFVDTVKEAVTNEYGSIDAYVTDIKQASMAYEILANIDKKKRDEIRHLILEWTFSIMKVLPENDNIDNYSIHYSPYSLAKVPRKEDWSRRPTAIEIALLNHYTEQLLSVNRQMDSYNKKLK